MIEFSKNQAPGDEARLRHSPTDMASVRKALEDLRQGRHADAAPALGNLVQQYPAVKMLWVNLALAAAGCQDFAAAGQAFQRATELAPNDFTTLYFVARQYYKLRWLDRAFDCLKRALAADSTSVEAQLTLASWLERTRRLEEAWECAEACLASHPKNVPALYVKSFLLHRKGLNGDAETVLRDLLKNELPLEIRCKANHLLAVVLDALGRYAEALSYLGRSKALQRKILDTTPLEKFFDFMDARRRGLVAKLTPEMLRRWREEAAVTASPHRLALLAGAPRSGTTLIEQILAANSRVLVFDETRPFPEEVLKSLNPLPPAAGMTPEALDNLAAAERARLIGHYFKGLLQGAKDLQSASLLLDKNPSLTAALHFWLRLFPDSKVIIALRDPRDVIISSYFQNLPMNWINVNFLSLKGTVKHYSSCMDVWLRLRELGGFDWIETRYESVVDNLEAEGRRVTSFLGLPWDDAQTTYYESARDKFIFSPTYHEVTQPVHKQAVGRWKHYAEALAPFQPVLEKYRRAFGYST